MRRNYGRYGSLFGLLRTSISIYCDNKSVVDCCNLLIQKGFASDQWRCSDWWKAIADLHEQRKLQHIQPLRIQWILAHVCENVSAPLLDPAALHKLGTTVQHVLRNRDADRAAKQTARSISPIRPDMIPVMHAATALHHEWLVKLHCQLTVQIDEDFKESNERQNTPQEITVDQARALYPTWPWQSCIAHFGWKPKIPQGIPPPKRWKHHPEDWHNICKFLRSLQWREQKGQAVAFCELATAEAIHSKVRTTCLQSTPLFAASGKLYRFF